MTTRPVLRALHLLLVVALAVACGEAPPPPVVVPVAQAAANDSAPAAAPEPGHAVPVTSADPQQGDPLAPVTLVEWGDFQCPFTGRFVATIRELQAIYGEKLRVVWKNEPLPFHAHARDAAVAAETVHRLGGDKAFWKFHALAFENQAALRPEAFAGWAGAAGVDKDAFQDALGEKRFAPKIDADHDLGKAIGVSGTPASFVNGVFVSGAQPIEKLRAIVDEQLAAADAAARAGVPRERLYAELSDKNYKKPAPSPHKPAPPEDTKTVWRVPLDRAPVRGKADALVTIVMWSDFQCPFSARAKKTIDALLTEYEGKIRLVARQNPLPFHKRAEPAAELALEARAQKGDAAFWKAFDLLFAEQAHLEDADLEDHARALGLDVKRAMTAVHDHKHAAVIQADQDLADDVDATGTPHFFIDGRRLVGAQPAERFRALVDEELVRAADLVKHGTPAAGVYAALQKGARAHVDLERVVLPAPTSAQPGKGAAGAKVVVQVFADFQCAFCKREMPVLDELLAAYPGKVRVVWRHLPLTMHKQAGLAAEAAAEAFAQKGDAGFWKMAALLYEDQDHAGLERPQLERRAAELGLDAARFARALDSSAHKGAIDADGAIAAKAMISATPSLAIGDYFVSGAQPLARLKRAVERALGAPEPIAPGALHSAHVAAEPVATTAPAAAAAPTGGAPTFGAKHVLVMYAGSLRALPGVTRTRAEARQRAAEVVKKARAGAPFADLVAQYSDEPGASARGGDLGTWHTGSMIPAFQSAVEGLAVGALSEVVETPFGFHVIVRTK